MQIMKAILAILTLGLFSLPLYGASCCGGGGASGVTIPKFMQGVAAVTLEEERYDGFWNGQSQVTPDPAGSDLKQQRLSFAAAYRVGPNWQVSGATSWVENSNVYSGESSHTSGLGDSTFGVLYENFDNITCVNEILEPGDWMPASFFGLNLTVPTGISPYDEVDSSFDITGRGFYRLGATALVEKTIYPWSATINAGADWHLPRVVNREYGQWVQPYNKQLGNRFNLGLSAGYTWFMDNLDQIIFTYSLSHLEESASRIDGNLTDGTGMKKRAMGLVGSYAWADQTWIFKMGLNRSIKQDGMGTNFPITETFSFGVSHVFH